MSFLTEPSVEWGISFLSFHSYPNDAGPPSGLTSLAQTAIIIKYSTLGAFKVSNLKTLHGAHPIGGWQYF